MPAVGSVAYKTESFEKNNYSEKCRWDFRPDANELPPKGRTGAEVLWV